VDHQNRLPLNRLNYKLDSADYPHVVFVSDVDFAADLQIRIDPSFEPFSVLLVLDLPFFKQSLIFATSNQLLNQVVYGETTP